MQRLSTFQPPLTIDASRFADRPTPRANLKEGERESSTWNLDAVEEEKKETIAKEQEVYKDGGRKAREANDVCTLETCGEEKVKREARVERSARKELLDENISPMVLSEMINSSIKEAVQTIVKQCSMVSRMQVSTIFDNFRISLYTLYISVYNYVRSDRARKIKFRTSFGRTV